jgi:hypothetical protein
MKPIFLLAAFSLVVSFASVIVALRRAPAPAPVAAEKLKTPARIPTWFYKCPDGGIVPMGTVDENATRCKQ